MGGPLHLLPDQLRLETGLTVRPPNDSDNGAVARLLDMISTAALTEERLVERRVRYAKRPRIERVAEYEGQILGWLEFVGDGKDTGGFLRLVVDPAARSRGVGAALYDVFTQLDLYRDSQKVKAEVKDDEPLALAFAEARGFAVRRRVFESTLDLTHYDITPYLPLIERVKADGFRIATVAEMGDTEENRHRLWEVEYITDADIPGANQNDLLSWEDARDILFTAAWYDPAAEFVLLDGDRWVGISGVAEVGPGEFYNQHTATLREYRGRGLATALKALSVDYAKQRGGTLMRTNNHEGNDPMLAINRKMGYIAQPGWYELERRQNHD